MRPGGGALRASASGRAACGGGAAGTSPPDMTSRRKRCGPVLLYEPPSFVKDREGARPIVTTVERSDIRGLVTTVSFPSGAFLILRTRVLAASRRPRGLRRSRGRAPSRTLNIVTFARVSECSKLQPASGTWLAIAHMKAASSRAIAVTTTLGCLPRVSSFWKRLHSRTCARQAIARTGSGRSCWRC